MALLAYLLTSFRSTKQYLNEISFSKFTLFESLIVANSNLIFKLSIPFRAAPADWGNSRKRYAITKKDGLYGMINKQGKVVIENKYEKIKVGRYGDIRAVKEGQEILIDIKD